MEIKDAINNEKFKTAAAAVGAVIMYFTPPPFDAIITAVLFALGVETLVIKKKDAK
jgi:hypothetical protein